MYTYEEEGDVAPRGRRERCVVSSQASSRASLASAASTREKLHRLPGRSPASASLAPHLVRVPQQFIAQVPTQSTRASDAMRRRTCDRGESAGTLGPPRVVRISSPASDRPSIGWLTRSLDPLAIVGATQPEGG